MHRQHRPLFRLIQHDPMPHAAWPEQCAKNKVEFRPGKTATDQIPLRLSHLVPKEDSHRVGSFGGVWWGTDFTPKQFRLPLLKDMEFAFMPSVMGPS